MEPDPGEVTVILNRIADGDRSLEPRLLEIVYGELHRLAKAYLRRERANHTLQPTALINEAYIRLLQASDHKWRNRSHFVGVAAKAMRNILVDHARSSQAQKRNSAAGTVPIDDCDAPVEERSGEMLALDEALHRLDEMNPRLCKVVELRYFAGLTREETAEHMGTSVRTVHSDWQFARAWLHRQVYGNERTV